MNDEAGLDDLRLLELSRQGSQDAWTELFRRHHLPVYRFAAQMTGAPMLAEEIAQEAFVFLLDQPAAFRPDRGALRPWLIGVARNKLLRAMERDRRFLALDRDFAVASDSDRGVLAAQVRAAVAALPPEFREVVVLCELEELSYEETAAALRCPLGTVRSRLYRARRLLMEALAPAKEPREGKGCLR